MTVGLGGGKGRGRGRGEMEQGGEGARGGVGNLVQWED